MNTLSPMEESPAAEDGRLRTPFNSARHDHMCVAGLWLGVLAAGLCILAAFGNGVIATQGGAEEALRPAAFAWVGATFAVLIALTAIFPWAWARFTGIALLPVSAIVYAFLVIGPRTSVAFTPEVTVELGSAGTLLVVAFLLACLGLTLALVGAPRIGRPPRTYDGRAIPDGSGYATASLVLSLCGLVSGITAALGVAFAASAFDDIARAKGTRSGRGLAVAGLVVGIVIIGLSALVALALMLAADPSIVDPQDRWGA